MTEVETPSVGRTLVRNTAWNYAGFAINLVANIAVFPVVVRQLGDAAAGIWLVLGSVTGYMGLLRLGIVPALTRFVASQLAEGDLEAVNRRASTAMALVLAGGSLALAAIPWAPWFAALLHVPEHLQTVASVALVLGLVGFFLQLPGHIFNALLNGAQRQDLCSQVWIASTGIKAATNLALLWAGFGLVALLWLDLVLIVASGALLFVMARRAIPTLRFRPSLVRRREGRELTSLGGLLVIIQSCRLAIEQSDRLVVGAFLTVSMVTYYSAAWKLYVLAYSVPTTLLAAVGPMAGARWGRGDHAGLRHLFLRTSKYSAAVAWPMVFSLAGCAAPLLELWVGPGFGAHAPVVHVLLAAFAVTAHNHAGGAVVLAKRRVGPIVWQYEVPQAILNVVLSIWLVQRLGIIGVALGTAIPALALEYFFMRHVLGEVGVGWREFWREVVAPSLLPAWCLFSPLGWTWWYFGPYWMGLLPTALGCSLAYAAWFWFGSLGASERDQLRLHFRWRTFRTVGPA